jgi:hypothetical protein
MLVVYFLIERALKVLDVEDGDWLFEFMFSSLYFVFLIYFVLLKMKR